MKNIFKYSIIGIFIFFSIIILFFSLFFTIDSLDGKYNIISETIVKNLLSEKVPWPIKRRVFFIFRKKMLPMKQEIDKDNIQSIELIGSVRRPYGIDFIPMKGINQALITSKNTKDLVIMQDDKLVKWVKIKISNRELVTDSNFHRLGFEESPPHPGLHDIAFDPEYNNTSNQYIYLSTILKSKNTEKACSTHAILKLRYDYQQKEILDNPILEKNIIFEHVLAEDLFLCHNLGSPGNRIVFLNDGTLIYSVGDSKINDADKRLRSLNNKILRMTKDGEAVCNIPQLVDNPYCNKEGANDYIYSIGHKNIQGLTVSKNNTVYASEHGEHKGDEINIIEAGKDYGYPFLCLDCTPYDPTSPIPIQFVNYKENPKILHSLLKKKYGYQNPQKFVANFTSPFYAWENSKRAHSIAPAGIANYEYGNNQYLLVATLNDAKLEKLKIENEKIIRQEPILSENRFREVYVYDETTIYVLVNKVIYDVWKINFKNPIFD